MAAVGLSGVGAAIGGVFVAGSLHARRMWPICDQAEICGPALLIGCGRMYRGPDAVVVKVVVASMGKFRQLFSCPFGNPFSGVASPHSSVPYHGSSPQGLFQHSSQSRAAFLANRFAAHPIKVPGWPSPGDALTLEIST